MEVCEECENCLPEITCQQCGQALCLSCDKKIHNKGKRLLHVRVELKTSPASPSEKSEPKSSVIFQCHHFFKKQDAHLLRYQQQQERFHQHQKQFQEQPTETPLPQKKKSLKKLNLQAPCLIIEEEQSFQTNHPSVTDLLKNSDIIIQCPQKYAQHNILSKIENYLRNRGNSGDLMIHLEEFSRYLKSKEIHKINNSKEIITQLETCKLIHITTRKFGDSEPIQFVSLLLDQISLESLCWILRSIRKDQMTPTDKLVASRIKECFGIKLSSQDWTTFLAGLHHLQDSEGIVRFTVKKFSHKKEIDQEVCIKLKKCPVELISNNTDLSHSKQYFHLSQQTLHQARMSSYSSLHQKMVNRGR